MYVIHARAVSRTVCAVRQLTVSTRSSCRAPATSSRSEYRENGFGVRQKSAYAAPLTDYAYPRSDQSTRNRDSNGCSRGTSMSARTKARPALDRRVWLPPDGRQERLLLARLAGWSIILVEQLKASLLAPCEPARFAQPAHVAVSRAWDVSKPQCVGKDAVSACGGARLTTYLCVEGVRPFV